MKEEVTDENIARMITSLINSTSPIERVILCNEGTVQTLLSVLFNTTVNVEIISQMEFKQYILRWSKLVAHLNNEPITVCLAESVINKEHALEGFMNGIKERKMGIGQLISALHIGTERRILGFDISEEAFSRTYTIKSPFSALNADIDIIITEVFLRGAFERFGIL